MPLQVRQGDQLIAGGKTRPASLSIHTQIWSDLSFHHSEITLLSRTVKRHSSVFSLWKKEEFMKPSPHSHLQPRRAVRSHSDIKEPDSVTQTSKPRPSEPLHFFARTCSMCGCCSVYTVERSGPAIPDGQSLTSASYMKSERVFICCYLQRLGFGEGGGGKILVRAK